MTSTSYTASYFSWAPCGKVNSRTMAEISIFPRLLFRYTLCLVHLIGISYHCIEMDLDAYKVFGGRFKFLTFLNMVLQWIYFTSAAVTDFHTLVKKRKSEVMAFLCDMLFAVWVFPVGLTVSLLFWALYMMDPYSCQNEREAKLIPTWLNQYMHTLPGIAVFLEIILFKHEYPSKSTGIRGVLMFGLMYTLWIFLIAYYAEFWVYPFFEKMSLPWIVCFFGCAYGLLVLLYLLGDWLAQEKQPAAFQPNHKKEN